MAQQCSKTPRMSSRIRAIDSPSKSAGYTVVVYMDYEGDLRHATNPRLQLQLSKLIPKNTKGINAIMTFTLVVYNGNWSPTFSFNELVQLAMFPNYNLRVGAHGRQVHQTT